MKIGDFSRTIKESSGDARITTSKNKYGNMMPQAGLTSGGRIVAYFENRKQYVAENQDARKNFAQTLKETYGEGFDVSRLKFAGSRALTASQVATWIKRGESHAAKVGKQNAETGQKTVESFESSLKDIAGTMKYRAPIHPKILEATKSLVEQTIATRSRELPPITPEAAKKMQAELIRSLIGGLQKNDYNKDLSLHFEGQPKLDRVVGFATSTSLTGSDFTKALREISAAPYHKQTELLPKVNSMAVNNSDHVVSFFRDTDFSKTHELFRNVADLMKNIGEGMESATKENAKLLKKPNQQFGPEESSAFRNTVIATAVTRLDDKEIGKLIKVLKSHDFRDMLGLLKGINEGFPQDKAGRKFYSYPSETQIVARKTFEVMTEIISQVAKHPASGSFSSDSVEPTGFKAPSDVPEKIMQLGKSHQRFGEGVYSDIT